MGKIVKEFKLLCNMVKNDFVNRFSNTSLGAIWGFVSPVLLIALYAFVFEYILKSNSSGKYPYLVWFLPGIAMWTFLNEAILVATNSIREYSYLVKKIVFPINVIYKIKVFSSAIVALVMLFFVILINLLYGYAPNILLLIYYTFAAVFFILGITKLTSTLAVMLGDFTQIVPVVMQLMFWATPTIWNIETADPQIAHILKFNPLAYLVCGYRDVFVGGSLISQNNFIYTIVFWVVTILITLYANKVFNRNKDEFADII